MRQLLAITVIILVFFFTEGMVSTLEERKWRPDYLTAPMLWEIVQVEQGGAVQRVQEPYTLQFETDGGLLIYGQDAVSAATWEHDKLTLDIQLTSQDAFLQHLDQSWNVASHAKDQVRLTSADGEMHLTLHQTEPPSID